MLAARLTRLSLIVTAALILTAARLAGAAEAQHDRDGSRNDRDGRDDRQDRDGRQEREDRNDHGDRNDNRDSRDNRNRDYNNQRSSNERGQRRHFADNDRVTIHDYYQREFHGTRCPPGLKRRNNNCMAPGHDRQWQLGQRLQRGVIFYEVPPALVVQIGQPPRGSRYVRVAGDILLISIATGLVIDAIEDLDR